ncbi:MAG: GNAT family N-acetyltransferase [Prevotella sp.]|nr:GNAT family N-acetyltransferase [Prevotella sp.]
MNKVTLRALEPEDLDELYAIENDETIWNVGQTNVPYSRYALHDYLAHASADIFVDRQVRMMIVGEEGESIGLVDIMNFDPQHRRAELGIVIKQPFRHQGNGRAAIEAVMSYAERHWHLNQLYVVIDKENKPSISLFDQMGFEKGTSLKSWLFDGHNYRDAIVMQKIF